MTFILAKFIAANIVLVKLFVSVQLNWKKQANKQAPTQHQNYILRIKITVRHENSWAIERKWQPG